MKLIILSALVLIAGCSPRGKSSYNEVVNENYTIQVMALKSADISGTSAYKVRILPRQKILDQAGKELQNILWYRVDSAFYMTTSSTDIPPRLVQPVANGIPNCYEYMLVFNDLRVRDDDGEVAFVFNDSHITQERYLIKLSPPL